MAAEWYQKSADQRYKEVQFALGGLYAAGLGVPQDYKQAETLCRKTATHLDVAQFALGQMYILKKEFLLIMVLQKNSIQKRLIKGLL